MNRLARYLRWCYMRCEYGGPPRGWHPKTTWECRHPAAIRGLVCSPRTCPRLKG